MTSLPKSAPSNSAQYSPLSDSDSPIDVVAGSPPCDPAFYDDNTSSSWCRPIAYFPRRYKLIILCFIAVAINYSDRTNISVAVIKMAHEFGWSNSDKGWVLSAFLVGYLISGIPGGFLSSRYGGKRVMTFAALFWSLFTVLTPWAAYHSYAALVVCRVFLGVAEGMAWPAVHQLMSVWFPAAELARAISFFTSGSYFGTVITMLLSPPMISAWGWPCVFYVFGGLGFVFLTAWEMCVTDSSALHKNIHADEVAFIEANLQQKIVGVPSAPSTRIPWCLLFSSKQLWAFYINFFASGWSFFVLLAWMPDYFKDALNVDFDNIGFVTVAPFFFQGACAIGSGVLSQYLIDRRVWTAEKACVNMQLIGLVVPAIFLTLLGYSVINTPLAVFYLTAALSANAFTCAGVSVYHQLVAPRFAGLIFSIGNTFSIIPGVIGIAAAGSILDATHSWSLIFLAGIACYVVGIVAWLAMAKGRCEALEAWEHEDAIR